MLSSSTYCILLSWREWKVSFCWGKFLKIENLLKKILIGFKLLWIWKHFQIMLHLSIHFGSSLSFAIFSKCPNIFYKSQTYALLLLSLSRILNAFSKSINLIKSHVAQNEWMDEAAAKREEIWILVEMKFSWRRRILNEIILYIGEWVQHTWKSFYAQSILRWKICRIVDGIFT